MKKLLRLIFIFLMTVNYSASPLGMLEAKATQQSSKNNSDEKQKIIDEFKNKLMEDENFQNVLKNDNTISIEDDLNKLLNTSDSRNSSTKQNERTSSKNKELYDIANSAIGDGNDEKPKQKDAILEELKKMEEEYDKDTIVENKKNQKTEEKTEEKKTESKTKKTTEEKNNATNDNSKKTNTINLNDINSKIKGIVKSATGSNKQETTTAPKKTMEVLTNDFPITDTGVSYEYLYTKEYLELLKDNTSIAKPDPADMTQPPMVEPLEKQLVSFDTSDIPQEILAYERSEKNLHIPTVILIDDTREIAAQAIEQNNLPVLRGVLEKVKDPDFILMNGQTLINYAAEFGQEIIIRYLIYSGANLNRQDHNGNTALHNAILKSNTNVIKILVSNGASLDILNNDGNTALMLSITRRMVPVALYLLQYPSDITITNENEDNALTLSRKYRLMQIQQIILNKLREKALEEQEKVNLTGEE